MAEIERSVLAAMYQQDAAGQEEFKYLNFGRRSPIILRLHLEILLCEIILTTALTSSGLRTDPRNVLVQYALDIHWMHEF